MGVVSDWVAQLPLNSCGYNGLCSPLVVSSLLSSLVQLEGSAAAAAPVVSLEQIRDHPLLREYLAFMSENPSTDPHSLSDVSAFEYDNFMEDPPFADEGLACRSFNAWVRMREESPNDSGLYPEVSFR